MKTIRHQADLCVVGGGLAGMCAAVAAARHGIQVVLMHDRPVLGGNASSEIRVGICGARGKNMRETGIVHEIELENLFRNPAHNYSILDSILYEIVRFQPNLTLLLNCSCNGAEMDDHLIRSIRGWQLTTETWHEVSARYFADCSGDSILASLSGADFRIGREAASEFHEDIEPPQADRKTMGMTCLINLRDTGAPQPFIPPAWAHKFPSDADINRYHQCEEGVRGFWWIELGGENDSIHDTEMIRDELLKTAYGIWDHVKNHGDHGAENWALEWVGFLPGKRESRRYVGDHILTQNDVRSEGRFEDLIAYGGWSMDDHPPAGIRHPGKPTIHHPAPSPYGIPYRSIYSRNIGNLFFAGRNISATHAAMSSARVMGTCGILGQAAGTAVAIAARDNLSPRGVYENRLKELQQTLMEDDCYLPWNVRKIPALSRDARLMASEGNPEPLRNGVDRPVEGQTNSWTGKVGAWVEYRFDSLKTLSQARLVFASNLTRFAAEPTGVIRAFRLETLAEDGSWRLAAKVENNHQRLVRVNLCVTTAAIRFLPEATWDSDSVCLFAWDVR